mgnify:FL=1
MSKVDAQRHNMPMLVTLFSSFKNWIENIYFSMKSASYHYSALLQTTIKQKLIQSNENKNRLKTGTYKIVLELGTMLASFQAQAKAIRQN